MLFWYLYITCTDNNISILWLKLYARTENTNINIIDNIMRNVNEQNILFPRLERKLKSTF